MILTNLLQNILELFYGLTSNYGLSIILLSLTVSIMMLPLFWVADKLQTKESQRKLKMQDALDKIKNLNNKQEKFFYTKEIYKQHNYKPYYALSGLVSLVIQIPFFLAAFSLLENHDALSRVAFGPIQDLFRPDHLIIIREQLFNFLPIAMTLINLYSSYLYTKNKDAKEKIQLIVIALIFFVILYQQSAALVLYWTIGNLFTALRNLLKSQQNKVKNTQKQETLVSILYLYLKKHKRETITLIGVWAIYFLTTHYLIEASISGCFTAVISLFIASFLFDILIVLSIVPSLKTKGQRHTIDIIKITIFILGHLAILYARISPLAAYDILKYFVILQVIYLSITLFIRLLTTKRIENRNSEIMSIQDLCVSLLLLFPLLSYITNNQNYFTTIESYIYYFSTLIGIPILTFVILKFLLRGIVTNKFTFIIILTSTFTFYILPITTNTFKLTAETNILIHTASLLVFTFILSQLYYRSKLTLSVLSIVLCSVACIQLYQNNNREDKSKEDEDTFPKVHTLLSGLEMKKKPDIYLLIYDAYVEEKQMNYYGVDNRNQMQFLENKDFVFYDETYTLWPASLGSMSRVLDMCNLQSDARSVFRTRIGNSTVNSILQKNGYKTHYLLSSYFYSGCSTFSGDYRLIDAASSNSWRAVTQSISIGEFKYNVDFKVNDLNDSLYYKDKLRILNEDLNQPKFLYSHIHNPGHSQNSGKCLTEDRINYANNVASANIEMQEDVNTILSMNRDAIIIIAGDHGAYLTGDCLTLDRYKEKEIYSIDLADRYGMFLAIKYPDNYMEQTHNNEILQDVFFNIFSDLFENNEIVKLKPATKTFGFGKYIPDGVINKGIINYGRDKGKPLYWDVKNQK